MIGESGRMLRDGGTSATSSKAARALSIKNAIMLCCFDEPTAHLDIETTEAEMKERMLPLVNEQSSCLFATHRLATGWKKMDYILVILIGKKGQLVEQGTR